MTNEAYAFKGPSLDELGSSWGIGVAKESTLGRVVYCEPSLVTEPISEIVACLASMA